MEHGALLRVGGAQVEHVGQPHLHRLVGLGDRCVRIGHRRST
jgi:hypothetical protein